MTSFESVRCDHCGKNVEYHMNPVNHKKQFLLTLMTLGMWLPIWIGAVYCPTKFCNECDNPIWRDR